MKVHKNGEYFSFEIAKNEISQIINDITLLKIHESKVLDHLIACNLRQFPEIMKNLRVIIEFSDCVLWAIDLRQY